MVPPQFGGRAVRVAAQPRVSQQPRSQFPRVVRRKMPGIQLAEQFLQRPAQVPRAHTSHRRHQLGSGRHHGAGGEHKRDESKK